MLKKTRESLFAINTTPKTGQEALSFNDQPTSYHLLDLWRWSVSDLLSNTVRGRLAEFIVGTSLGLDPNDLRTEWDNYDLKTSDGLTLEVKSAAYLQSWKQDRLTPISFSIKPTHGWTEEYGRSSEAKRQADIYVFCHLKHKDPKTIDPLKLEQWDFYVVPTEVLNSKYKMQNTIGLISLTKLCKPVEYLKVKDAIGHYEK